MNIMKPPQPLRAKERILKYCCPLLKGYLNALKSIVKAGSGGI